MTLPSPGKDDSVNALVSSNRWMITGSSPSMGVRNEPLARRFRALLHIEADPQEQVADRSPSTHTGAQKLKNRQLVAGFSVFSRDQTNTAVPLMLTISMLPFCPTTS